MKLNTLTQYFITNKDMGFSLQENGFEKKKYEIIIAEAIQKHMPDMFAVGSEDHLEVVLNSLCKNAKSRIWLLSDCFNKSIFSSRCMSTIEDCASNSCDIRIVLKQQPDVEIPDKLTQYIKVQTAHREKMLPSMIIVNNDYFGIQLVESSAEYLICYYDSNAAMKNLVLPMIAIFESTWKNL